jgi:hypothetical protein
VILLDTNVISELVRTAPDPAVVGFLRQQVPGSVYTASLKSSKASRACLSAAPCARTVAAIIASSIVIGLPAVSRVSRRPRIDHLDAVSSKSAKFRVARTAASTDLAVECGAFAVERQKFVPESDSKQRRHAGRQIVATDATAPNREKPHQD